MRRLPSRVDHPYAGGDIATAIWGWGTIVRKVMFLAAAQAKGGAAGCTTSETGSETGEVKPGTWTTARGQTAMLVGKAKRDGWCVYAGKHNTTFEAPCQ